MGDGDPDSTELSLPKTPLINSHQEQLQRDRSSPPPLWKKFSSLLRVAHHLQGKKSMPLHSIIRFLPLLILPIFVKGQSCSQFGTLESTGSCSCPPGFGGSDCTQLLCSNPILPPSSRATLDPNVSGNPTVGCNSQCTEGFEGVNCNVCTTNNACAVAATSSSSTSGGGLTQGLGEPICSTGAWTWTQGFGSCAVDVSLLQILLPRVSIQ